MSLEQRRKISESRMGQRLSDEHKKKVSRGVIRAWALRERR